MITYQIDKTANHKTNDEIKRLLPIISEIAPTLQSLLNTLSEHHQAISTPTIDSFRMELQQVISQAAQLTQNIPEEVQRLVSVSDQAGKHLSAIEEHFGATLRGQSRERDTANA